MIEVVLKKGKEKSLLRRHPWVYDTAVGRVAGKPASGETVRVTGADGRFLAWGAWSPASTLRVRVWSFDEEDSPEVPGFFHKRVEKAVAAREGLRSRTDALRVIFGEADGLPGLIVDTYGPWAVAQFLSAGAERHKAELARAVMEVTGAKGLWERSDAATRRREGLEECTGLLAGEEPPEKIPVVEDGVRYQVDVRIGHKTGFYVDQRESRLSAQRLAQEFRREHGRGLRALNCFCYTGGFSLALARGGADSVTSVDSSADAIAEARANAALNDFGECRLDWQEADVFAFLRAERDAGRQYDLVILDPPKFASSRFQVERAARAYKDIALQAMRILAPGGHLFTFSCSGAVDTDLFQKITAGAVFDARRDAWALERFGAGVDHPVLMTFPEGEYLKGLHLVMRS